MTAMEATAGGRGLTARDTNWEEGRHKPAAWRRKSLSEERLWSAGLSVSTALVLLLILVCLYHAFGQWTFTPW